MSLMIVLAGSAGQQPAPLSVRLVGPAWWVSYLVPPLLAATAALTAAWAAHHWSQARERRQHRKAAMDLEREAQVQRNVRLDALLARLGAIDDSLALALRDSGEPREVDIGILLGEAAAAGLAGVLPAVTRTHAAYEAARRDWGATDASQARRMTAISEFRDALGVVRDLARATLDAGYHRLNQIDLAAAA